MRQRYTLDETERVVAKAAQLMSTDMALTTRDAIMKAQDEVLPEERRKRFISWSLLMNMRQAIDARRKHFAPAPISTQDYAAPQEHTQSPSAMAAETPAAAAPDHLLVMGDLLEKAARRFAKILAQEIVSGLVAAGVQGGPKPVMVATVTPAATPEQSPPLPDVGNLPAKFVRHKVAIFGLEGNQRQTLTARFPHLDLRFLSGDAKGSAVEQASQHAQTSFSMVKFVRHTIEKHVKGKHVRVNGGVSELTRMIAVRFPVNTSMDKVERASVETSH